MSARILQPIIITTLLIAPFVLASWILPQLQLRPGGYPRAQSIPPYHDQGDDAFFIAARSKELSHIVLYHDIGQSIRNARQADILLFGNSHQQTGLREAVIAREAGKLGLRVFTIATGHADKTRFALELIRKHDLRPRVVVASGGPHVFTEGVSPWAQAVMTMNPWHARKAYWEGSARWAIQSRLHRYLPRLDYVDHRLVRGWITYRSETTGWWRIALEPSGHFPVRMRDERKNYKNTVPLARELKQELDARDALLVLTMVPYSGTRSDHLPFLSETLGVPFILPSFEGMETSDGSHLNHDSAMRIPKDFWTEFIALAAVRKQLGLSTQTDN